MYSICIYSPFSDKKNKACGEAKSLGRVLGTKKRKSQDLNPGSPARAQTLAEEKKSLFMLNGLVLNAEGNYSGSFNLECFNI